LARFSFFHEQTFRRHFQKAFRWVWFIPKAFGTFACVGTGRSQSSACSTAAFCRKAGPRRGGWTSSSRR
jgi:hypothetical protein